MNTPESYKSMASRRQFLQTSSAFALGFVGLHSLVGCQGFSAKAKDRFGPLISDPDGVMDLPENFTYNIVTRMGDLMDDGFYVPGAADGMATFKGTNGETIVIRNHEVNSNADPSMGAFGPNNELIDRIDPALLYDAGAEGSPALGGTTTFIYDTASQQLVSQYLSLAGTLRNCAGGPTPWNTWITCEETTDLAGNGLAKDHGYVFQVPASVSPMIAPPVPIRAMGRFNHEAVAVDPKTNIIYQTEDAHDSLIYRFIPLDPNNLEAGGKLQALEVIGMPSLDTRNWDSQTVTVGSIMNVKWIDMDEIEAPLDDLRIRGFDQGAARFARGEGMWYGNDAVYFACTNGGHAKYGQIWRLTPSEDTLELFIEPNDPGMIENADNLTVTPWGDLIVCEDGSNEQFLVGVTPEGELYKFARNAVSHSELAGATFSPDGTTLFVNIQHDGLTLAISGPWT
ncbi:MAG: DUF839 domain-containing protein [Bacteroidetes bacterium]|nr:DUF839 domain-containing protein [Bacteroidota bacterium]